jgi:hypothetical protein
MFIIDACNEILYCTGYGRYQRKLLPEPSPSTLQALHIDTRGLYGMLKTVLKLDIKTKKNVPIKNKDIAIANPTDLFGYIMNMDEAHRLCRERNTKFDNRVVLTSCGTLYLQVIGHLPKTTRQQLEQNMSKGRSQKDTDYDTKMQQLKNTTKRLYSSLVPLKASARRIKKTIKDTRHSIKLLYDSSKKAH